MQSAQAASPPPPPPPPPVAPTMANASVSKAGQTMLASAFGGVGSTNATGGQGLVTPATTTRKTLLGS